MTDEEELAGLNGAHGDDAELAKLNAPPKLEGELRGPAPAPEKSIWQKGADFFGISKPSLDTIPELTFAAQNGLTQGLAPKIGATGEYALRHPLEAAQTVGHGLAPETVPATPSKNWDEILAKHQSLYGQASEDHPVVDVGASLLTGGPELNGAGLLAKAGKLGGAAVLQNAARQYGESPEMDPTKAIKPVPLIASGVLGAAGGAASHGFDRLASGGETKAADALAKNSSHYEDAAESARRSAGRGGAEQTNAAIKVLGIAEKDSINPRLTEAERQAALDFIDSEKGRRIASQAHGLNMDRAGGLESARARADAEIAETADKYSPANLEKMKQEALDKPQLMPRLLKYAKGSIPTVVGLGLGHLTGHDVLGTLAGTATGAAIGSPDTALRNMMRNPAFQRNLGQAMSGIGHTAGPALASPLTPRAASSLADYFAMMKDKETP